MRRIATNAAVVVIALEMMTACNGGTSGLLDQATTTAAVIDPTNAPASPTTTAPPTSQVSGTMGTDGLTLEVDAAGFVDVPVGSLPVGTSVSVEVLDVDGMSAPDGTTFVGPALRISAMNAIDAPVLVGLPVRDGTPSDDLWLLHVSDDGTSEVIGGAVERGIFVAAVRSFSDVTLLHGTVSSILGIAGVPPVDLSFGDTPAEDSATRTEQAQFAAGERTEPAPRVVRIVGPGELGTRDSAISGEFFAVGFESRKPRFVEYTWNLFGGDGAVLASDWRSDHAEVTTFRPGRYTLTVDARDPATGATAFAAKRILAVEGFVVSVDADRPLGYCCDEKPIVMLNYIGGTDPVVLDWAVGTASGQNTFDEVLHPPFTWIAGPIDRDTMVEVIGRDGAGTTSSAELVLRYEPGGSDVLLVGPTQVDVGQEAVFTAQTLGLPTESFEFVVWPAAAVEVDGSSVHVTWDEPGIARVGVYLSSEDADGPLPVSYDVMAVEVAGDAEPTRLRVRNAPANLAVGEEGTWAIRVRGGILAAATGFRGYQVAVDFGDGSELVDVSVPSDSAATFADAPPVTHSYQEAGGYDVTITATPPQGDGVTMTFPVTVSDRLTLEGTFLLDPQYFYEILENEIAFAIDGTAAEITVFSRYTTSTYQGFTIGDGAEDTFVPDCLRHSELSLVSQDLTFDPSTQTIGGTAVLFTDILDIGTNCAFGGADREEEWSGTLTDAVIVDGVITQAYFDSGDGTGAYFTASVVETIAP